MANPDPLLEPARHPLPVLLRALRRGRSDGERSYLTELADTLDDDRMFEPLTETPPDDPDYGESTDPADWWKS